MTSTVIGFIGALLLLIGCNKAIDLGDNTFLGATRIGDGLTVKLKKNNIALELEGKMNGTAINGTMVPVPGYKNSVFSLRQVPGMQIILSHNGLIVFSAGEGSKFGVALANGQKPYDISRIAGMYNFVLQYHSENKNKYSFGTFALSDDNTWRSWRLVDGLESKAEPNVEGHWIDKGNGEIHAFSKDQKLFGIITLSELGNLMVINLLAKNGLALGTKRANLEFGSINGEYIALESEFYGVKNVFLTNDLIQKTNPDPKVDMSKDKNKKLHLIYNKPWPGLFMAQTAEFIGLCAEGACFALNIGTLTGKQFIVAAVKQK